MLILRFGCCRYIQRSSTIKFIFQGLLNSKDLSYISENYFSLTKPQDVHVNINFENTVMFEDIMEADEIQLLGIIQDGQR